ncbi:MAG: 4-alpha-glucanotransferase [Oscillospiraceae bacterium]|nr:4-alpha-glucanotransferase [Oscillospiraceae bacterium]
MQQPTPPTRSAGVLLPLPALHGPDGIGTMGREATDFIDFLARSGFHAWQMLPVEHTGSCFSPYKCVSAFAGEPMLIDPQGLLDMGLITEQELAERRAGLREYAIDYPLVQQKQRTLLRTAYARLEHKPHADFNPFWLDDYALYMVLKRHFDNAPWYDWPNDKLRRYDTEAAHKARTAFSDEIDFHRFVQWLFDAQWHRLKHHAAERDIALIGDIPIYVSEDSAEVWSRRTLFEADADGNFPAVGGAPPDYFNPDGQRWGNPVYNWPQMAADGYKWWIDRMAAALERFDRVRLDHFRGFDRYWRIPTNCSDGKGGVWTEGPGIALFEALEAALGKLPVFAEDLGTIDEGVEILLERTGFPGVRVLQFGFDDAEGRHLPHNYPPKSVAYTGTHDNTTLLAWMFEMRPQERDRALFYTGFTEDWTQGGSHSPIIRSWMRTLYMSGASLVIVPVQDLLGYGADTRTNVPGTAEGNWRFRMRGGALEDVDCGFYAALSRAFGRDNPL